MCSWSIVEEAQRWFGASGWNSALLWTNLCSRVRASRCGQNCHLRLEIKSTSIHYDHLSLLKCLLYLAIVPCAIGNLISETMPTFPGDWCGNFLNECGKFPYYWNAIVARSNLLLLLLHIYVWYASKNTTACFFYAICLWVISSTISNGNISGEYTL